MEFNTEGEIRLFQAILKQQICDAAGKGDASYREQAAAQRWMNNSRSFREVCTLAGLDPDAVFSRHKAGLIDVDALGWTRVGGRDGEDPALTERRNRVNKMFKSGLKRSQIARELGLTRHQVNGDIRAEGGA